MSKPITIGQSHNAMSILANNVDWRTLDAEMLQRIIDTPRESGVQFTAFLRNGGRVIVGGPKVVAINRNSFNPAKFIGKDWSVVSGEPVSLSTTLTELDLTKVQFVTMLKDGESYINGEEKLKRLKSSNYIRLDADIFLTLWENQHLIPESWKEKVSGNTRYIFFDGTILRHPNGHRYVLYLDWNGGQWYWSYGWLGRDWSAHIPSAVLAA
jgi:hypothetical protein